MNNGNHERGIRYFIRRHVEKHAVRPWFSGATAIAGAIAGLLGALYADQIKEAFPFFWGAGHIQFHAVAFWGLVILFGWMFGANFWAQSNATDRQLSSLKASTHELKAGVSAVHETSRSLIDLVRTLPPHDFLENFAAYLYRCYPAAVRALGEGAGQEEITEGIVSVLSSLVYTTKFFDAGGSDTEYSANVMIYRDFRGLDAAKIREYEQGALFTERQGTGATAWSGVLELAPELAVFLRRDEAVADPERLPPIILEIPRNEFRMDRGRKAVLPGAPDAFCDRAYVFFHDAREMGNECRTQRALRQSVGDQIERYFTEGVGQTIRSFVSIPLEQPSEPGEVTDPLGVVNIHSSRPQMLRGRGVQFFVPLTAPHRLLIAGLLRKLLRRGR